MTWAACRRGSPCPGLIGVVLRQEARDNSRDEVSEGAPGLGELQEHVTERIVITSSQLPLPSELTETPSATACEARCGRACSGLCPAQTGRGSRSTERVVPSPVPPYPEVSVISWQLNPVPDQLVAPDSQFLDPLANGLQLVTPGRGEGR